MPTRPRATCSSRSPSMADYGRLSGRDREEQIAGARVDVAPYKQDPADFVLWKPSAPTCPAGTAPGGAAGRAGTSSARPCRLSIWARPSTSTAAASTWSFPTTRTSWPSRPAPTASPSCASGCTTATWWSAARRCPSRSATSSPCTSYSRKACAARRSAWRSCPATTGQPLDITRDKIAECKAQLDRLYEALRKVAGLTAEKGAAPEAVLAGAGRRPQHPPGDRRPARPRRPAQQGQRRGRAGPPQGRAAGWRRPAGPARRPTPRPGSRATGVQ